jgi:hypothetical protein
MGDMADAGNGGGECLGGMDSGGGGRGGNADADEERAGDLAECHAERAVDHLRGEADQDERKQG